MKRLLIIIVAILLLLPYVGASSAEYDAIIVRNDIPIEYVIAMPYANTHDIPILPVSQDVLTSQEQKQLSGYYQNGATRILILGGKENAISVRIESTIRAMGFDVDRKWGFVREDTAASFALDLWQSSSTAVLLNGSFPESYLVGMQTAMNLECPILLATDDGLPEVSVQTLGLLGVDTVYIIGSGSVPESVYETLESMSITSYTLGEDISVHQVTSSDTHDYSLPWPAVLFIGILIGLVAVYIFMKKSTTNKPAEVPLFVLTEDERKVVDAIEASGGEIRQEQLPDKTLYSRPKVSRIVNDLEAKKILLREKHGKTYKVKIAKKFIHER